MECGQIFIVQKDTRRLIWKNSTKVRLTTCHKHSGARLTFMKSQHPIRGHLKTTGWKNEVSSRISQECVDRRPSSNQGGVHGSRQSSELSWWSFGSR